MGVSEETLAALKRNLSRDKPAKRKRNLSRDKPAKRKRKRDRGPSENAAHRAVAKYLDDDPRLAARWFHPANGEHRNPIVGAKLKAMGVKPGVPDIWIIAQLVVDGTLHPGVVIELKRERGGRATPEQERWLEVARAAGFVACVCHGAADAIDTIRALYANVSI